MKAIPPAISAESAPPAATWARSSPLRSSSCPKAEATKNLELRTNALAKNILTDENGDARGVAYIDRKSKQEVEVYGRAVVVAASCVESARILLNSKSRLHPNGVANSSQQLGRNLCDHLYGESARGYLPQLVGRPRSPTTSATAPSPGCRAGKI